MIHIQNQHSLLLAQIKRQARSNSGHFNIAKYLGTTHVVYNVSVPNLRQVSKAWAKENKDISIKELVQIVDALFNGKSREEKVIASMILGRFPKLLVDIPASSWDQWLGQLVGWEEVDSFCDEVDVWLQSGLHDRVKLLEGWNTDKQLEKRRASLVVLCSTVRTVSNPSVADLSFRCIDTLKHEKQVMITKAISWLLRTLLKYHRSAVVEYLQRNSATLPALAVREVTRKLETGKK